MRCLLGIKANPKKKARLDRAFLLEGIVARSSFET